MHERQLANTTERCGLSVPSLQQLIIAASKHHQNRETKSWKEKCDPPY